MKEKNVSMFHVPENVLTVYVSGFTESFAALGERGSEKAEG